MIKLLREVQNMSSDSATSSHEAESAWTSFLKTRGVNFASGAIAGGCEIMVTMPLDTIKTQMQLKNVHAKGKNAPATGMLGTTREILSLKGVSGFYYGLGAMLAQVSLKAGIRFAAFEQMKIVLGPILGESNASSLNFTSGVCAGMIEAAVWVTPTERLKVLLQQQIRSKNPQFTSMGGAVSFVLREQGPQGLMVGLIPTAARQGLAIGVRFALYGQLKELIAGQDNKPSAMQQLTAGMATGTISALLNQPIDTAKSRIQAQSKSSRMPYTGLGNCLRRLAVEEGVASWYRGSFPRVARLTIGQGIIFCIYDQIFAVMKQSFGA